MYTNVYKGEGGLNTTKNTHLYAGLLKMLQYLKHLRDWSLSTGRGGATNWENCRTKTFCAPPPFKTG